ncbi:MAG: family 20 glycosylhydrolase [Lachnospiraceae bacterium]|nr:family 20 glycosylhydrolase [Lachnospiraceae bacterium]
MGSIRKKYVLRYDREIVLDASCGEHEFESTQMLNQELKKFAGFSLEVTRTQSEKAGILLKETSEMEKNGYRLTVSAAGVVIEGGSETGLFYGIQTLRQMIRQQGACLPYADIFDYPGIEARGLLYDVTRGRVPTMEYLKTVIDRMAFYKMNQLQIYIEHSFLMEGMSEIWRDDTPLTAEEILELDAYCRARQIELIPAIGSFGHLYKVLRTRTWRHLCELPDQADEPFGLIDRMTHHTLDVSNPDSFELSKKLIDAYLPLFTSKHFNIGADETFDLGKGRSRKLAEEKGLDRIYLDYLKKLCTYLTDRGRIPMFWGDIIREFPEAIHELPRETICLNWDYRPDVEENTTSQFAINNAVQYCCPGVHGWNQMINRMRDSYENISRMCTYAAQYHAAGVLTTDWGDYGHINHPDFGIPGMIYGAAFSWNPEIPEFDRINREISRVEFLDSSETIVSVAAQVAEHQVYSWRELVDCKEHGRNPGLGEKNIDDIRESARFIEADIEKLYSVIPKLDTRTRPLVQPCIVAAEGAKLLQEFALELAGHRETDKKTERGECAEAVCEGFKSSWELASKIEEWFYLYKKIWRKVSRESELFRLQEVIDWCADTLRSCTR